MKTYTVIVIKDGKTLSYRAFMPRTADLQDNAMAMFGHTATIKVLRPQ